MHVTKPDVVKALSFWFRCDTNNLYLCIYMQGCDQIGRSISVPPTAILGGLLILTSFFLSPSSISVPGTDWVEPSLIWLTINMPTGSRKSTVYQLLLDILKTVRSRGTYTISVHMYITNLNVSYFKGVTTST